MNRRIIFLSLLFHLSFFSSAQQDTTRYQWPISPVNVQRNISGTFGEYRSTSANGHYHNGTDIPASAGTPVLAVLGGVVGAAFHDGSTGYDSYVRITSNINGQTKNITYYHTIPLVSTGQTVSMGQQISTIAVDHVHLIEYRLNGSLTNSHLNAIRTDGGLINYNDTWKPHIRYVKFLVDNSTRILQPGSLGSRVDIAVHVEEVNGTSSSAQNNGTYKIGYKILSADTQTVIYNPPDNGQRFEYYNIPLDAYVNVNYYRNESSTSQHVYLVTNGTGASNVKSTQVVQNSFWDVDQFPYGAYTVMVFTEDSRGNGDTIYIPVVTTNIDLIPPGTPQLRYIKKESEGKIRIAWTLPTDADLKGFRLFQSEDGISFSQLADESILNAQTSSYVFDQTLSNAVYYKIFAVDTASAVNVSSSSDTYGIKLSNDSSRILVVDGFDRYGGSGSWSNPYHDFVRYFGESINHSFESCSNDEIISGSINLSNYTAVLWISGDESTVDEVFNAAERGKISVYLNQGGKLFASGSEIAWDLEGSSSATQSEILFLRNYLKGKYAGDDSNILTVSSVSPFPALNFSYGSTSSGSPYNEDYPDIIDTVNGSSHILRYSVTAAAGIAYTGTFGTSQLTGQVVYFGFPFETIHTKVSRINVMNAVLNYFGLTLTYGEKESSYPAAFNLYQNYPNPFNPATEIKYSVAETGLVKIAVYDVLGREVAELLNEEKSPGEYSFSFNGGNLASGVYIYRMESGHFNYSRKMLLLK